MYSVFLKCTLYVYNGPEMLFFRQRGLEFSVLGELSVLGEVYVLWMRLVLAAGEDSNQRMRKSSGPPASFFKDFFSEDLRWPSE